MPVVIVAAGGTEQPPEPQGENFPNLAGFGGAGGVSGTPANHTYGDQGKPLAGYDVIVLLVGVDAGSVVTGWPPGFVPIASITSGGVSTSQIAVKISDGTELQAQTFQLTKSGSGVSIAYFLVIDGADLDEVLSGSPSESQIAVATNSGTGTSAGPPADISGLPAGRRLFANLMTIDGTGTTDSFPANMPLANMAGLFNEETFVSVAQTEGQSFDVGPDHTWSNSGSEEWANALIGIVGAAQAVEIEELALVNPSADGGSVAGWTNALGTLAGSAPGGAAGSPEGFFYGGTDAHVDAYQDVAVPSGHVAGVDEGRCKIRAHWYGNSFQTDRSRVAIEFYDNSMVLIEGPVARSYTSFDAWTLHRFIWPIPAGTRTIRYIMQCDRLQGTNNDGYIDENQLWIHESH